MKARLTQKLTQKMALTPQMRQSIHILQLPLEDIQQEPELKESAAADNCQVSGRIKNPPLSSQEKIRGTLPNYLTQAS